MVSELSKSQSSSRQTTVSRFNLKSPGESLGNPHGYSLPASGSNSETYLPASLTLKERLGLEIPSPCQWTYGEDEGKLPGHWHSASRCPCLSKTLCTPDPPELELGDGDVWVILLIHLGLSQVKELTCSPKHIWSTLTSWNLPHSLPPGFLEWRQNCYLRGPHPNHEARFNRMISSGSFPSTCCSFLVQLISDGASPFSRNTQQFLSQFCSSVWSFYFSTLFSTHLSSRHSMGGFISLAVQ